MFTSIEEAKVVYKQAHLNHLFWFHSICLQFNPENPKAVHPSRDLPEGDVIKIDKGKAEIKAMQRCLGMSEVEIAMSNESIEKECEARLKEELGNHPPKSKAFLADFYVKHGNPVGWEAREKLVAREVSRRDGSDGHSISSDDPLVRLRVLEMNLLDLAGIQKMEVVA